MGNPKQRKIGKGKKTKRPETQKATIGDQLTRQKGNIKLPGSLSKIHPAQET
jgi:hypothetical protein